MILSRRYLERQQKNEADWHKKNLIESHIELCKKHADHIQAYAGLRYRYTDLKKRYTELVKKINLVS